MRLHHVGIVTDDVDSTAALFVELLDLSVSHSEQFDGMAVRFLELPAGYLELLEPVADGPVSRFLEERGPGLHHLAFTTPDIDGALETARRMDIRLIDERPRAGAWGHDVAFLHPADTAHVLIEFVAA